MKKIIHRINEAIIATVLVVIYLIGVGLTWALAKIISIAKRKKTSTTYWSNTTVTTQNDYSSPY